MTKLTAKRLNDFMNDEIDAIRQNNSARPNGTMWVYCDFAMQVQNHFEDRNMTKTRVMDYIDSRINSAVARGKEFYRTGHDSYGKVAYEKSEILADLRIDIDRAFAS